MPINVRRGVLLLAAVLAGYGVALLVTGGFVIETPWGSLTTKRLNEPMTLKAIQDAGADALELNIYFVAADPLTTSEGVEARYLDILAAVRQEVTIPVAVKVGPYFSAMANMAQRLVKGGANGLVLFNRFLQPDIDLETLQVTPHLVASGL